jgi:NADPH-dependent curcumin reductase CurA
VNRQLRLAKRPVGEPTAADFEVTEVDTPSPDDGEVLVQVLQISLDPAMRGWMDDRPSYIPPVGLGEVMRAGTAGVVLESRSDKLKPGDHVVGMLGVQEQAVATEHGLTRVDTSIAPLETYLGALGMPGLTAYFGLTEIGEIKEGDTVVVSGAAGAVGSVAGQVARAKGAARVVGIAGGAEKCSWIVDDLRFDAAIDYKSESVGRRLHQLCPDGIDVYFDNVGGEILDAALANLAMHARVVICGAVSQYNAEGGMRGPSNYMMLLVRRARMQGYLVFDYMDKYRDALREMGHWLAEGKLKARENVIDGTIDDFPASLMKLFRGENVGKLVLQIADEAPTP